MFASAGKVNMGGKTMEGMLAYDVRDLRLWGSLFGLDVLYSAN